MVPLASKYRYGRRLFGRFSRGCRKEHGMGIRMTSIIGIDVGTTFIKAILFNECGESVAQLREYTPLETEGYNPAKIRQILLDQVSSLLKYDPAPLGIVVTGMAEAGLILDDENREMSYILPWFDRRPANIAKKISDGQSRDWFRITGLHRNYKYGIFKYLYLKREGKIPGHVKWLSMCDYAAFVLTGDIWTVPGFAARTYLYDIVRHSWSRPVMDYFGVTEEEFPRVLPEGNIGGYYRGKIPVAIAGHDHICAAEGILSAYPKAVCDSAGTSETYISNIELRKKWEPDPDSGRLYGPFYDNGWYSMVNIPSSGHSVEWFRTNLQRTALNYQELDSLPFPDGPTHILYFPYLTGQGSPCYSETDRGAFLGLHERADAAAVFKAILEGIQYQAAMQIKPKELVCAGGSSRNSRMMQIKADIFGCPVRVPAVEEATLTGAAAIFLKMQHSRIAASHFLSKPMKVKKTFYPSPEEHMEYRAILDNQFIPAAMMLRKLASEGGEV